MISSLATAFCELSIAIVVSLSSKRMRSTNNNSVIVYIMYNYSNKNNIRCLMYVGIVVRDKVFGRWLNYKI